MNGWQGDVTESPGTAIRKIPQKILNHDRCLYSALLIGTLILYGISCAPGLLWQDSGLIQYRVWQGDLKGPWGLALSHPLYYLVAQAAKALPWGHWAARVNLISCVAGAITVANLSLFVRFWSGSRFAGCMAGLSLAVSHTFWRHASIAETYTLWAAFWSAELLVWILFVRARRTGILYLLGLLNGLAVAVHLLGLISGLCYGAALAVLTGRRQLTGRHLAGIACAWLIGASPLLGLMVQSLVNGSSFMEVIRSVLFGNQWQSAVLNTRITWDLLEENLLFGLLNFPTPTILCLCVALRRGWAGGWQRTVMVMIVAQGLLFLIFAGRYTVPDRYGFFIPFYGIVAALIGWGTCLFRSSLREKTAMVLLALVPVGVYGALPGWIDRMGLDLGTRGDVPYREDVSWFIRPWKTGYHGARRFATEALEQVAPDAVIYADLTTAWPLRLLQEADGFRPDVVIQDPVHETISCAPRDPDVGGRSWFDRPVYVVSEQEGYCPDWIRQGTVLTRDGVLWAVRPLQENGCLP